MRLLLDTQLFLWFAAGSAKLPRRARAAIAAADEVFVSAVSIWEASIKSSLGKLDVDPRDLVAGIDGSGFIELRISAVHAAAVWRLPPLHGDPFDRLLVAQAVEEPMRLATTEATLRRYSELVDVF